MRLDVPAVERPSEQVAMDAVRRLHRRPLPIYLGPHELPAAREPTCDDDEVGDLDVY